jgi:arylsulfatase
MSTSAPIALATLIATLCWTACVQFAAGQDILPAPPPPFKGKISRSVKDSKPDFPQPVHAPKGAPNILLILLDDVGFGASSTFGGPANTPTLEALAKNGLRYNEFHTTALCSPTRAALLTGRNHHSVHTGVIMEAGTGYPGYDTLLGKDTTSVAEILRQRGWNTAWIGKDHNVPDWQNSQAGPFDLWPTGLGFEYFYGFIGGDTNQWRPNLTEGTKPIEPYIGNPDYNFDYDIADQAIRWLRMQHAVAADRPFFLYYAPGATHAPHQPKKEWIEKYKGKFDQGWDKVREETIARQKALQVVPLTTKLTVRPDSIPAWDSLTPDQKQLYAHMMEIYAGYLEQTDYNIGRVLDVVRESGQLDNTLVIYIVGDNGASAEGSLQGLANEMTFFNGVPEDIKTLLEHSDDIGTWKSYNHYPVGWAHAMDTPFQWTKQIASHFGGTRNGMVVSWPTRIKNTGGLRSQFHHVIDIVPTILEVCHLQQPLSVNGVKQKPIEGVSLAYTFDHPAAKSKRNTQYFEMLGNRAIYHDGWVAATTPAGAPWEAAGPAVDPITGYNWELYHVSNDFSESDDLAKRQPEKLKHLQALFYKEAARYNVLPIDNSKTARMDPAIRPSLTRGRTSFTYYEGMTRIPEAAAPDVKNKSFSITAVVDTEDNDEGVLITQGGLFGGYALMLRGGKPLFHYNFVNVAHYSIGAEQPITQGKHTIVFNFSYDGGGIGKGGTGTLSVDGKQVAQGRIDRTTPIRFSLDEGLDVGEDTGTPVSEDYDVPFKFTGKIENVTIDIKKADSASADEAARAYRQAALKKALRD